MPRQVDQDARRAQILDAALRVFAHKGFAASRIEDVAAAAGIAKGSVYLYFDSRDALLEAAFAELDAASTTVLEVARTGQSPPLERIADLVHAVLAMATARPELARLLLDLWTVGRSAVDLPLDMARVYQRHREVIAELLAEAAATGHARPGVGEAEATVILGAVEGCLLQWVVDPRVPAAGLGATIVTVCLDGLRAGGSR